MKKGLRQINILFDSLIFLEFESLVDLESS